MTDTKTLIQATLKYIGIRPRSRDEIQRFVSKKSTSINQTDEVIAYLDQHRLIDDAQFTSWYIESRQRSKPRSKHMLSFELRKYGITLPASEIATDEVAAVEQLLERYQRRLAGLPPLKARAKAHQYLQSRGFSSSAIAAALKNRYNTSNVNDD